MFELTYPQEPAPVLPPFSIDTRDMKASEYFPVIEPSGMVVARASREYCHGGAKPLHPVVHLHGIDRGLQTKKILSQNGLRDTDL